MEYKVVQDVSVEDQVFDVRYHPTSENNLIGTVTIAGDLHL